MSKVDESDSGDQPASDISALYAAVGLDARGYKEFKQSLPSQKNRAETSVSPSRAKAFEQSPALKNGRTDEVIPPGQRKSKTLIRPVPAATTINGLGETAEISEKDRLHRAAKGGASKVEAPSHRRNAPEGDFRLLDHLAQGGTRRPYFNRRVIGLLSSAGGVGKSTLAAALSVALSEQVGQCAVVSWNSASLLSCYLGGLRPAGGEPTVYKSLPVVRTGSLQLAVGDVSMVEMLDYASQHLGDANCIVVDVETAPDALDVLPYLDRALMVLRPDIGALLGIEQLDAAWALLPPGPKPALGYIINQYDPSLEVHRRVRQAIDEHSQGRLFAPELPADAEVQAALANGEPPQTKRPESGFSRGIERIASKLKSEIDERRYLARA